jgi:hypothetical protein
MLMRVMCCAVLCAASIVVLHERRLAELNGDSAEPTSDAAAAGGAEGEAEPDSAAAEATASAEASLLARQSAWSHIEWRGVDSLTVTGVLWSMMSGGVDKAQNQSGNATANSAGNNSNNTGAKAKPQSEWIPLLTGSAVGRAMTWELVVLWLQFVRDEWSRVHLQVSVFFHRFRSSALPSPFPFPFTGTEMVCFCYVVLCCVCDDRMESGCICVSKLSTSACARRSPLPLPPPKRRLPPLPLPLRCPTPSSCIWLTSPLCTRLPLLPLLLRCLRPPLPSKVGRRR